MLAGLWFRQSTVTTVSVRTIPYSEFKEHLDRGEVVQCSVEIVGRFRGMLGGRADRVANARERSPYAPISTGSSPGAGAYPGRRARRR